MPRKQRIEYPGAVYHVIRRGNYRKELFLKADTGGAFEHSSVAYLKRWLAAGGSYVGVE